MQDLYEIMNDEALVGIARRVDCDHTRATVVPVSALRRPQR